MTSPFKHVDGVLQRVQADGRLWCPTNVKSVTGYGLNLKAPNLALVGGIWRRAYVAQFSNIGTLYVRIKGERVVCDLPDNTTHERLSDGRIMPQA